MFLPMTACATATKASQDTFFLYLFVCSRSRSLDQRPETWCRAKLRGWEFTGLTGAFLFLEKMSELLQNFREYACTVMICHATTRALSNAPPHFSKDGFPHDSPHRQKEKEKEGAREREREHSQQLQCPIIAIYSCRSSMIVSFSDPYICLNLIPTLHMTIRLSQFCRSAAAAAGP